eukprot:GHVT01099733.1.p1 GENE.GHVT01099733.1~~GHVT01099733.1.p1  ORF type:complete len:236 (-),score=8.06 GHVT01099733.1:327-1034(-)
MCSTVTNDLIEAMGQAVSADSRRGTRGLRKARSEIAYGVKVDDVQYGNGDIPVSPDNWIPTPGRNRGRRRKHNSQLLELPELSPEQGPAGTHARRPRERHALNSSRERNQSYAPLWMSNYHQSDGSSQQGSDKEYPVYRAQVRPSRRRPMDAGPEVNRFARAPPVDPAKRWHVHDPVSRGAYFRELWKTDPFLQHQVHPKIDVPYRAWLAENGHVKRMQQKRRESGAVNTKERTR